MQLDEVVGFYFAAGDGTLKIVRECGGSSTAPSLNVILLRSGTTRSGCSTSLNASGESPCSMTVLNVPLNGLSLNLTAQVSG
jgi:hypothetical protein